MAVNGKAVRRGPPQLTPGKTKRRSPSGHRDWLKERARLLYTTDPYGVTCEELAKMPEFADVGATNLKRWARDDNWGEARKEVFARWRQAAEERLGSEICRVRLDELRQLQDIRRLALGKLQSNIAEVKSWEGLVRAFVTVGERIESLALSIGQEIVRTGEKAEETKIDLTEAELEVAIEAILKARIEAGSGG